MLILAGLVLALAQPRGASGPLRAAATVRPAPGSTGGASGLRSLAAPPRTSQTAPGALNAPSALGLKSSRSVAPSALASGAVVEVPDPEAAQSFPSTASHHARAITPASAAQIAPGAPSDAEVKRELAQMNAALGAERAQQRSGAHGGASISPDGTATSPPGVPQVVAEVIAGANAIATFPYVYGAGHASFVDNAYDCSGSVSYALAAGGLLAVPEASGQLESWGAPGPGRWITVYANAGHTYMYIDGLRYDTSGRSGIFGSRWQAPARSNAGFVARHWPGL